MNIATWSTPKAEAHAAFININAITPDFTALPILGPLGSCMAIKRGVKIIKLKGTINARVVAIFLLIAAKYRIQAVTTA
ncbi:hypothetical protein D3C72_2427760 [compost metagenome]